MTYPDFIESTGYGTIEGLCGVNCRHTFRAAWDFTKPFYSPEQLDKLKAKDKDITPYEWKDSMGRSHKRDFTLRQALDRQRTMENQMRKTMSAGYALKEASNEDGYNEARSKYLRQLSEYRNFSKVMDIKPQMERVYMAYPGGFHEWMNQWGTIT